MRRVLFALAVLIGLAAPVSALDPPPLGKVMEIDFSNAQKKDRWWYFSWKYSIQQGDRFHIQMETDADVKLSVQVYTDPKTRFEQSESFKKNLDWKMSKTPPGSEVFIHPRASGKAKVKILITKVNKKKGSGPDREKE